MSNTVQRSLAFAGLCVSLWSGAAGAAAAAPENAAVPDYTGRRVLAGACWRGNVMRTGEYRTRGVAANPRLKWKHATGGPVRSSPVVFGGSVYIGAAEGVLVLDAASGAPRWTHPVEGGVLSSACVADGLVYIGGNDGVFYALDAATGEVKWKVAGREPVTTSAVAAYGAVFVEGPVAFDALTGKKIWGRRIATAGDRRLSSVALAGDKLVQNIGVCDVQEGRFVAGSGGSWIGENVEAVWGDAVIHAASGTGGGMGSLGGGGGAVAALELATLKIKWVRSTAAADATGKREILLCSPAVVDGLVYIGTEHGEFLAIDAEKGTDVWTAKTGGAIRSSAAVSTADGIVCVGSDDGKLHGFDAKTGAGKWAFATGGKVQSSPCPSAGVVYVGSDDGKLYALEGE
jgi:serine/threonine-protein kinase